MSTSRHPRVRLHLAPTTSKPPRASSLILGLTLVLIAAAALASALVHSFAATSFIGSL